MRAMRYKGSFILLLTSFIWGMGFVAQKLGVDYMPPFSFNGARSILGALVLLPVIFLSGYVSKKRKQTSATPSLEDSAKKTKVRPLVIGGLICGICMFVATNLQQLGLVYTTAGKAGFITAMYILIVPLMGVFLGKVIRPFFLVFLALAVLGLYLLCVNEALSINRGDFYVLLCAVVFSIHILVIDYFVTITDPIRLSSLQLFVNGLLSLAVGGCLESFSLSDVTMALPALLYAGICSSGMGYTLQMVGQKMVKPVVASLVMSMESVFAVLGGVVILGDKMTAREMIGCILMFIAIIFSQLYDARTSTAGK